MCALWLSRLLGLDSTNKRVFTDSRLKTHDANDIERERASARTSKNNILALLCSALRRDSGNVCPFGRLFCGPVVLVVALVIYGSNAATKGPSLSRCVCACVCAFDCVSRNLHCR